jgi:hypothetical protein
MKTAPFLILIASSLLWQAPLRAEIPSAAARREQMKKRIAEHQAGVVARQQQSRARLADFAASMERRREQARKRLAAR